MKGDDADWGHAVLARLRVVQVGLGLFLLVLVLRATQVMTMSDDRLEDRARAQFEHTVELRGRRGSIVDRNGRILAMDVVLPTLYASPRRIAEEVTDTQALDTLVKRIQAVTGRSEAWIRRRLEARGVDGRRSALVVLGSALDPEKAEAVGVGYPLDALWLEQRSVRAYPHGALATALLGVASDATREGVSGLERALERELAGDTVRYLERRDRMGRAVPDEELAIRAANPGHTVRLTIDLPIQAATERALEQVMADSEPERASAVVLDPRTGAILAMASLPSGNPNDAEQLPRTELFRNTAAMDQVEPGSTMKPFVVAAAMEDGWVGLDSQIDCEAGAFRLGDRVIRDDHPQGVLPLPELLKFSSNIGTAKLGLMLGRERLVAYLKDFGFGRPSGLDIPGEIRGFIRQPDAMRDIELAATSFGQAVTTSAVQLASAYGTLANGGTRMRPRLVDAVLDESGVVESVREPAVDRRVIGEETARQLSQFLESVTEDGGTGTRARVPGYRVAGKTGSAQKVEGGVYSATKRVGLFAGYLPVESPAVVIVVVVDSPTRGSKYGGIVAAPAFAEIGAYAMVRLQIPRSVETAGATGADGLANVAPGTSPRARLEPAWASGRATPTIATDPDGLRVIPNLRGLPLPAARKLLVGAKLSVRTNGDGWVAQQLPPAGTRVEAGEPVTLWAQED